MNRPLPEVPCDLPTPDALIINHPVAGLFMLVDRRVRDDDPALQHLRDYQSVRIDLHPHRLPAPFTTPPDGGGGATMADHLRAQIAEHVSAVTRQLASTDAGVPRLHAC